MRKDNQNTTPSASGKNINSLPALDWQSMSLSETVFINAVSTKKMLALPDARVACIGLGNDICILNLSSKDQFLLKGHQNAVNDVVLITLEGKTCLLSASDDHTIKLWDLSKKECTRTLNLSKNKVLSGNLEDKKTTRVSKSNNSPILKKKVYKDSVKCLTVVSETQFASGSKDGTVKIWNTGSLTCAKTLKKHKAEILSLKKISNQLASAGADEKIIVWNYETEAVTFVNLENPSKEQFSCLIGYGNDFLIGSGGLGNSIVRWNVSTGEIVKSYKGHVNCVQSLEIVNERLVSCSKDRSIRLWDIESGECLTNKGIEKNIDFLNVSDMQFFLERDSLVTAHNSKKILLWKIPRVSTAPQSVLIQPPISTSPNTQDSPESPLLEQPEVVPFEKGWITPTINPTSRPNLGHLSDRKPFPLDPIPIPPSATLPKLEIMGEVIIPRQDFKILMAIGKPGGFATVFKGTYSGKEVAIKQLHDQVSPTINRDFLKEISVMQKIPNPNFVKLHGACIDTHYFIIMELMVGSLRSLLDKKKVKDITWQERYRMAKDMVEGLYYIHTLKKPILHRDLKADNILLDKEGNAKLADLGLACQAETRLAQTTHNAKVGDGTEGACGTIPWMAPEIFKFQPEYSPATDIYAFAMILWEMGTHGVPGEGQSPHLIIKFVKKGERPPLTQEMPESYTTVIQNCWQQKPKNRPKAESLKLIFSDLIQGEQKPDSENRQSPPQSVLLKDISVFSERNGSKKFNGNSEFENQSRIKESTSTESTSTEKSSTESSENFNEVTENPYDSFQLRSSWK